MTDPVFSKRAAAVMNSPFWFADKPQTTDRNQILAWNSDRLAMREAMEQAVNSVQNYDQLPPDVRQVFDEAEAFGGAAQTE